MSIDQLPTACYSCSDHIFKFPKTNEVDKKIIEVSGYLLDEEVSFIREIWNYIRREFFEWDKKVEVLINKKKIVVVLNLYSLRSNKLFKKCKNSRFKEDRYIESVLYEKQMVSRLKFGVRKLGCALNSCNRRGYAGGLNVFRRSLKRRRMIQFQSLVENTFEKEVFCTKKRAFHTIQNYPKVIDPEEEAQFIEQTPMPLSTPSRSVRPLRSHNRAYRTNLPDRQKLYVYKEVHIEPYDFKRYKPETFSRHLDHLQGNADRYPERVLEALDQLQVASEGLEITAESYIRSEIESAYKNPVIGCLIKKLGLSRDLRMQIYMESKKERRCFGKNATGDLHPLQKYMVSRNK